MMSWFGPPKPSDPAFSVEVPTTVKNEGVTPYFWITKPENKSIVCVAPLALTIAITNLQPHPAKIDYYEVEALNVNDKWVKVPRIPNQSSEQKVYAGLDLANLTVMTGPFLDRLAVSTLFESHAPVQGWVFFDLPFPGSVTVFKVTVRDTEGHQFTSEPLVPPFKVFRSLTWRSANTTSIWTALHISSATTVGSECRIGSTHWNPSESRQQAFPLHCRNQFREPFPGQVD
jgi:hypothetical protein